MADLKEQVNNATRPSYLEMGRRSSDAQYQSFCEFLDQAKSMLSERGIQVEWPDGKNSDNFKFSSPVGEINAKRLSFVDEHQLGAAVLFYCFEAGRADAVDLCSLRLTVHGAWKLPGDEQVIDAYGRLVPASAVSAVMAAVKAKLERDHLRVLGSA